MMRTNECLLALGTSVVLALGVVLAQDQAPIQAPPLPLPQGDAQPGGGQPPPNNTGNGPAPEAQLQRPPPLQSRRPTVPLARHSAIAARPAVPAGAAPEASDETKEPRSKTTTPALKFDNTPADIIVSAYCEQTGKTPLWAPDVPKANITLKSQAGVELSKEEYIEAIEVVLSMNGIVLEPFGEKFVKVLARKTVRTDGIKINMELPESGYPEKTKVVSQMIQLKSITVAEAQKALEGFKKPDGLFQTFERTNSILVTDTQENINRMLEIVKFIDQPLIATEEVNVRTIKFAKAEDIKKRLEELVSESQKQTQAKDEIKANSSGSPGMTRTTGIASSLTTRPLPPGLTRLGSRTTAETPSTPNETLETLVSDADRGMIRGKVQIIADERTNQLIIITRADNMAFFDRIITVLDIETSPDVKVEVMRLQYAEAEDVSTMLNDLIGNATSKKSDKTDSKASGKSGSSSNSSEQNKITSLAEAAAARAAAAPAAAPRSSDLSAISESGKTKLGQLSKDNLKILSDKRTNALVMMGSLSDLAAIKEIVKNMDIQLSQVLIETVVIQVELGDDLETGIDWVTHKTMQGGDKIAGGGGTASAKLNSFLTAATTNIVSSGINYFLKSDKLNISAVITASKSDSRTKVLTSPILMTVDNKEATIESTAMRYLYKGVRSSYTGNSNYSEVPDYEQRDIGLTVKVTPRINPNGTVVLSIDEKFETIGANQTVGTDSYPTINTRKVAADVSVDNMQTVVLGGLVQNELKTSYSGIPILKDIPWVGKYLFGSTSKDESRSELLVFLTPYVLESASQSQSEALRRKNSLHDDRPWEDGGWSQSKLADPLSEQDRLERARQKWASEDDERDATKAYEKALKERQERDRVRAEGERMKNSGAAAPKPVAADSVGVMRVTEDSTQVVKPAVNQPQSASNGLPPAQQPAKKSFWHFF